MALIDTKLNFGCPMWSHPKWFGTLFSTSCNRREPLTEYSNWFNSVEGNTSFYQLPSVDALQSWRQQAGAGFSFTFKFPRDISHAANINNQGILLHTCLQRFAILEQQLGSIMLQLPGGFGPDRFQELEQFLSSLSSQFHYAVELRHMGWFDKGENETKLNRTLDKLGIDRVIMDTRGLFSCHTPTDTLVMEVQSKKPKIPTHVITTSARPIVRFVGHPNLTKNNGFLAPWIDKVAEWLQQGKQPYFFFHMPDNAMAPWLASMFFSEFQSKHPALCAGCLDIPKFSHEQLSIF